MQPDAPKKSAASAQKRIRGINSSSVQERELSSISARTPMPFFDRLAAAVFAAERTTTFDIDAFIIANTWIRAGESTVDHVALPTVCVTSVDDAATVAIIVDGFTGRFGIDDAHFDSQSIDRLFFYDAGSVRFGACALGCSDRHAVVSTKTVVVFEVDASMSGQAV